MFSARLNLLRRFFFFFEQYFFFDSGIFLRATIISITVIVVVIKNKNKQMKLPNLDLSGKHGKQMFQIKNHIWMSTA